jgi:hypothetical protein
MGIEGSLRSSAGASSGKSHLKGVKNKKQQGYVQFEKGGLALPN